MAPQVSAVCFDLDGTLVRDTTVSLHLARWLGHAEVVAGWEQEFKGGLISNTTVAERDAGYYKGVTRAAIWQQLESIPLIDGVPETIEWLRAHGIASLLATVTLSVAAEYFADRFGFVATMGCVLAEDPDGRIDGVVSRHVEPEDKVRFLSDWCNGAEVAPTDCAAVGDSRSDVPVFGAVGLAIALNASDEAKASADVALDTDDIRDIIPVIDGWPGAQR